MLSKAKIKRLFPFTWETIIKNLMPQETLDENGIDLMHPDEIFVQHQWCRDYYGSNYGRAISLKWDKVELLPARPMGEPDEYGETYLGYNFSKPGEPSLHISCHRLIADCFLPNFWEGSDRNKLQAHHLDHGRYNNVYTNIMLLPGALHSVMNFVKKTALFADGTFREMNLYQIMVETGLTLDEMILATVGTKKPERTESSDRWTIFQIKGHYIGFQFLPETRGRKKKQKAK